MAKRPAPKRYADIGDRLRSLRIVLGYEKNQNGFAERMGMTPQSWNNYETGKRRPELDKAMLIRKNSGATLDWIYEGSLAGLPFDLAEKLSAPLKRAAS